MPAQYDIKSIGDQVLRLTLQLEAEKTLTTFLFRLVKGIGDFDLSKLNDLNKGLAPKDEDAKLFAEILQARYEQIAKL